MLTIDTALSLDDLGLLLADVRASAAKTDGRRTPTPAEKHAAAKRAVLLTQLEGLQRDLLGQITAALAPPPPAPTGKSKDAAKA